MPPANPPDSELMGYVVRMVIPLKREFGRVLDVKEFFSSRSYALEVIDEALSSRDERLKNYAVYAQTKLFGARTFNKPLQTPGTFADTGGSLIQAANPSLAAVKIRDANANASDSETDKAQKEVAARYKLGLR